MECEARPPALVERLVAALIPPTHREQLLGDLAERYRSAPRFVAEALRALPFVVASQIRRTFNGGLAVIKMLVLLAAFRTEPGGSFFAARSIVPALAALAALTIHDAYASGPLVRPWRWTMTNVLTVIGAVALSQAVIGPMGGGLLLAWDAGQGRMLFPVMIALMFAWHGDVPVQKLSFDRGGRRLTSVDEIYGQIAKLEADARGSMRLVAGLLALIAAAFAVHAWLAPALVVKTGRLLASVAAIAAAGLVAYNGNVQLPRYPELEQVVRMCLDRLVLQKRMLRRYGWVVCLPILPAGVMNASNNATSIPRLLLDAAFTTGTLLVMGLGVGLLLSRGLRAPRTTP